eukprot:633169_1
MAKRDQKRRREEWTENDNHPARKRAKYNRNFVPIEEREQLTRKQIAERLHFESFNDEHTKVFTREDQLSILNKSDGFDDVDRKIENMKRQTHYRNSKKGMLTMLNDLCDLESDDKNANEEHQRQQRQKEKETKRLLLLKKQCENYKGNVKNIEWTNNVKGLTLETRERAVSKLLQCIKQNRNMDTKTEHNMSLACERSICEKSNTSIAYGQHVRDQLRIIRDMTKNKLVWQINIEKENDSDSDSDIDSDSDSDDDDDDVPIGLKLKNDPY